MTTSMKTLAGGLVAVMNPRLPPSRIMWTRYGRQSPLSIRTTSGRQWTPNGKVGRDVTVEQGYQAARHAGLIMLSKIRAVLGSSTASSAS